MNKNILKLSIILILVYSFTLPSFVYANPLSVPVIEFGTQFFQLFSMVLLFLTVTFGAFFKFLKMRFLAIKHKKLALLGIAVLFVALSFVGAFLLIFNRMTQISSLFFTLLLLLIITFVLLLKILDIKLSNSKYIKNILLSIVNLVISVFFIMIHVFYVIVFDLESWFFRLSYVIFLALTGLFIKFFKVRLSTVKYKKIISLSIMVSLGIISFAITYLLVILITMII